MASEWTETGRFAERNGKVVGVEHSGGDVRIVIRAQVKGGPVLTQIVMGGEHREAFMQLFAAAGFAAERHERAAVLAAKAVSTDG